MSIRRGRAGLRVVIGFGILATAGCSGEGLLRQPVSGYVKLDGNPLGKGVIIFYPVKGNDLDIVINGGAMVKDGYFSIPRAAGLIPGDYQVAIRAAESRRRRDRGPATDDEPVAEEVIPARYNSDTDLTIRINDRAIKEVTFRLDSH